MTERLLTGRRELILGAAGLCLAPSAVLASPSSKLAFAVFRNGTKVGEHRMSFSGGEDDRTITTDVALTVKVGPVPVYKYRHSALEKWSGGKWVSIETTTNGNGKVQKASGRQMGGYVQIAGPKGSVRGPASHCGLFGIRPSFGDRLDYFGLQSAWMAAVQSE